VGKKEEGYCREWEGGLLGSSVSPGKCLGDEFVLQSLSFRPNRRSDGLCGIKGEYGDDGYKVIIPRGQ
jgi:hypothetical protein